MAKMVLCYEDTIQRIADALRTLPGTEKRKYKMAEIASQIEKINADGSSADSLVLAASNILKTYTSGEVTSVREHCFYGLSSLKTVSLKSCTSLSPYAFAFSGLETVDIPSLTYIYDGAFLGTQLKTISDLSGVSMIGPYAFQNTKLATVKACTRGGTAIKSYAFADCQELTSAEIGCVYTGSPMIFNNCQNLKRLKFARDDSKVMTIYENSLGNVPNLKKIWIDPYVVSSSESRVFIHEGAFVGASTDLHIYLSCASDPSGVYTRWNKITDDIYATVHYGVTEAEFDALPDE